jgi:hypothetical protein
MNMLHPKKADKVQCMWVSRPQLRDMPREVIVVEESLFVAPLFESCNMYANFVIFQRHQQYFAGRQLSLSCTQVLVAGQATW